MCSNILDLGGTGLQGTYLLQIYLMENLLVTFGKFNKGKPISLPAGYYLYLGSAMGKKGATTLPSRLLRHTLRTPPKPPHAIFQEVCKFFNIEKSTCMKKTKTLHWHVDYLVDSLQAEIMKIAFMRSEKPLEHAWSTFINRSVMISIISPKLGASDYGKGSHLVRLKNGTRGWEEILRSISRLLL